MAKILTLRNTNDVVAIYEDSQSLGTKEQELVDKGFFGLSTIEGTATEIRTQANSLHPALIRDEDTKDMYWEDSKTGEIKKLEKRPKYSYKYDNGFISNIELEEDNHIVADEVISAKIKKIKEDSIK